MTFSKQLDKIFSGKIWRFFGGIKPDERKSTSDSPIEELGIPSLITLPLDRHLDPDGQLLVRVGDYVKAGQALTIPGGKRKVPLHATTSGDVIGINMQILPHPSAFQGRCISIKPDGRDEHVPPQPITDWQSKTPAELLSRIRSFGIEGLGGAQFQTAAKIGAALEEAKGDCNIFIVNGAECEPVATCDDRLMQEKADEIATGIEVVRHILQPKAIIVAIENNKPKAIAAIKKAVAPDVIVREIPTLYPSGAARNLIKICTGIEIPYNEHTSECGIVVDNVETVFAIKQAVVDGLPLIKRVITVDGQTLGKQGNALVRLGTSVRFVLNAFKLNPERHQRIILGGPFMGFTLPTIDVPLTKSATCIYVPSHNELPETGESMNCIRCGRCARVCPSRLVPYQLYAMSRAGQHKKTEACGMLDCTECGCCAYVCPSRIPLTGQFRKEKNILHLLQEQQHRNEHAQERMAARQERLQQEEAQRALRRAEALARAQQQKEQEKNLSPEEVAALRAARANEARARAAARRAAAAAAAPQGEVTIKGIRNMVSAAGGDDSSLSTNAATNNLNANAPLSVQQSSAQAQAKAHDMMQRSNKEGLLVAAMMAQGGTSAMRQEQANQGFNQGFSSDANGGMATGSANANIGAGAGASAGGAGTGANAATAGNAAAAEVENKTKQEQLPYSLRRGAVNKHATPLERWQAVVESDRDMSVVENPPEEGMVIPESKPRAKTYLKAPPDGKKHPLPLPSCLRRPVVPVPEAGEATEAMTNTEALANNETTLNTGATRATENTVLMPQLQTEPLSAPDTMSAPNSMSAPDAMSAPATTTMTEPSAMTNASYSANDVYGYGNSYGNGYGNGYSSASNNANGALNSQNKSSRH